jgi:hypothetical protein
MENAGETFGHQFFRRALPFGGGGGGLSDSSTDESSPTDISSSGLGLGSNGINNISNRFLGKTMKCRVFLLYIHKIIPLNF